MLYVKHKTTNITNIPRGQALYSTIDYSNALWTSNSSEAINQNVINVGNSGLQGGLLKTNSDHKELFDCICRGEIQLNHGALWHTVVHYTHITRKINHHSTAHAIST